VRMKPRKAIAGTFRRPGPKDSKGLSGPLADVIAHRDA
jgi:allantoin racemase